jgi:hypothetical protein
LKRKEKYFQVGDLFALYCAHREQHKRQARKFQWYKMCSYMCPESQKNTLRSRDGQL